MSKKNKEQEALVSASINSIYQRLLEKQEQRRVEFETRKEEEEKKKEEEKSKSKEEKKKAKEEKQKAWESVLSELTGQDTEYLGRKIKKRNFSYKQWFDIETDKTEVPKKKKKHNYSKEFEQELKMLRAAVSEQNKFTADLNKRFQNALGPAEKDASTPTKTMVDLASAINAGRSNTLGFIREIASIKKSIADLRMKQQKLDMDSVKGTQNGDAESNDLGLMGSSILNSIIGNYDPQPSQNVPTQDFNYATALQESPINIEKFDPNSWDGPQLANDFTKYESSPPEIIVEMNDSTGSRRFVALDTNTGTEVTGCNMPTNDPMTLKYDQKNETIIGTFGESYRVKHV